MRKTYYTAVGHFRRKTNADGQSYPVILNNQDEYLVDMQEMTVWTALNWRIADFAQLEKEYDRLSWDCGAPAYRTLHDCLRRLVTRGLVASGAGETDFEALYNLIGGLYVAPLSESLSLRVATFLKLVLLRGVPVSRAFSLFRRDRPSEAEARIMALTRQEPLSTAELIKCEELGVRDVSTGEKLMSALYDDDDTTSYNIPVRMRESKNAESVTMAVANLYLRKLIIFERV